MAKRSQSVSSQLQQVGKAGEFDYKKYLISHEAEPMTIKINGTEESFEISIKPLSWSKRNQLISKNLNWNQTGETSFSADGYVRDCLKEMIVEAPWGRTTESLLLSFDDRLGSALEDIVPKAFGDNDPTTGEKNLDIDAIKKEQ